ncbi:hypothetical protein Mapa_003475 [Marchantia paleacea]|nr:hypothetical protein Mapa_003475 [Marchantia paleacea]
MVTNLLPGRGGFYTKSGYFINSRCSRNQLGPLSFLSLRRFLLRLVSLLAQHSSSPLLKVQGV